ncbi:hypothetical protein SAMN02745248_02711 [Hathewaya proteolytica DSM 3090]|uniref:Uncharacterized protein n=1 Tax=Hathewaya proteolytica DSM 3090 TaxID=1121331 RepID=A0A1M6T351_9CLOT|nr:hypothetical protein [Hathewaya proteolytica]SHK51340.1 hypothetical protein SAMN02745248_02711 [Hathewaya proteolytica DSM 3090]
MALYKEIVKRHQNAIIIRFTAMIVCIIVISDFMDIIALKSGLYIYLKYIMDVAMIILFFNELRKIDTKYKYSVFQDQLMVYKLTRRQECLLRDVNICDIVEIKKCTSFREKILWFIGTRYDFYKIKNHYMCTYRDSGVLKKFYFNPSDNLLKILKNSKCHIE